MSLTLDLRNHLAKDADLCALLGSSTHWDTWIFADKPFGKIENSQKALIVITRAGHWQGMVGTAEFPRLYVDIWADPRRNTNGSVREDDTEDKILAIKKQLDVHLHLLAMPSTPLIWGTDEQVLAQTGTRVVGSQRLDGPDFSPIADGNGGRMGRLTYGVETFS